MTSLRIAQNGHHAVHMARLVAVAALALPASLAGVRATQIIAAGSPTPYAHVAAASLLAALPLAFEPNVGQTDRRVAYLARGTKYTIFLTPQGATVALAAHGRTAGAQGGHNSAAPGRVVVQMGLVGSSSTPAIRGTGMLPGTSSYMQGADRSAWHTDVSHYGAVEYRGVYPGVDMRYYGSQGGLEYDFRVSPGAAPSRIAMRFAGVHSLRLDRRGNLVLGVPGGTLVERAPVLYQQGSHGRTLVAGGFVLHRDHTVGFTVGSYNHHQMLVIDPVLSYSTYLSGTSFDAVQGVAVDGSGNVYVTGQAASLDFPTTAGAFQTANNESLFAAFVSKINPAASGAASLVYSTYLGGTTLDPTMSINTIAYGVAVDSGGNAYVTGATQDSDFPTTPGAFQTVNNDFAAPGGTNAFVTKLNPTGTGLVYSTYLGGSDPLGSGDTGYGIAVDATGNAYIAGQSYSADFPLMGAFQGTNKALGNIGSNAFVTKLNTGGTGLIYSTYLGGSISDGARAIALDSAGNAYVTGQAFSNDYPVTVGAFQTTNRAFANSESNAFVTKLNPSGSAPVYSTYLGGTDTVGNGDAGLGIAVDVLGDAYVTGQASSSDFPISNAFQGAQKDAASGGTNAFVAKLNPAGSGLGYSTYLGGSDPTGNGDTGLAIAVDGLGDAYVTGIANSTDFPVSPTTGPTAVQPVHSFASPVARRTVSGTRANAALKQPLTRPGVRHGKTLRPFAVPFATSDAFVTKLAPTGRTLGWSTFLGGSFADAGTGIGIDTAGNVDVGGFTYSTALVPAPTLFPVTANAFQTTSTALYSGFVSQLAVSYCQAVVTLSSGVNRLGLSYNVGAPAAMHNIEYITLQLGANTLTARNPITATCNVGKGPAVFTFTGTVSSARGIFSQGDVVTVTVTVYPPGGPATVASVTVTRGATTVIGPVAITAAFGSVVNVGTF